MNKKIIGIMSLASLTFSFFALSNNSQVIEAGAKVKITSSAIEQTIAKNQSASTTYSGTYYDGISATSGVALFDQLTNLIDDHTVVAYASLATVYHDSDVRPDGSVWDIYGDYPFSFSDTGNYSNPGDTWNKEHLIPQSWFGESSPMVSDAFHIYPSDGKINGIRSNYPLSEVSFESSKTYYLTSYLAGQNNGGNYKCGLGTSTVSGVADNDNDKAFEPADCYKGDFARSYFYFVTRYAKQMANGSCTKTSESTKVFNTNKSNFFLNPSYKELLLKWHHQDPVSYKEIDRCNGIYKHQKNRNPYIDHPEFVDAVFANGTYVPPVVTTPTLDIYTGTKGSEVKITTSSINKKVGDKFYIEVYVNGNGIFDTDNTITKSVSDSSVLSVKDYFYVNANIECLKAGTSTLTFKKSYQDGSTTKTVSKSLVINVTDDGSESGTGTGGETTTGDFTGDSLKFTATSKESLSDNNNSGATISVKNSMNYEANGRGIQFNGDSGSIAISELPTNKKISGVKVLASSNRANWEMNVTINNLVCGEQVTLSSDNNVSYSFSFSPVSSSSVVINVIKGDKSCWIKTIEIFYKNEGGETPPTPPVIDDGEDAGEDINPIDKSDTAGCEGNVISSSLLVSVLSLVGLGLISHKRKEN